MAVLNNCELWYVRCDPKYPNKKFNAENPTWEVQIRTHSKAEAKIWEENGLNVTPVIPDEGPVYFRANIKRNSFKKDGTANTAPPVTDGNLEPINPGTVSNGSIGNVRIYEFKYVKDGVQKSNITLMGIQVTTWLRGTTKRKSDFNPVATKVVDIAPEDAEGGTPPSDDSDF